MENYSLFWQKSTIAIAFASLLFLYFLYHLNNIFVLNVRFFKKVFYILKKLIKNLVVVFLIIIMNRKRLRTSRMTDAANESSNNSDLGNLKMFEFVRIKCTKSSEVRILKNEISNLASRFSYSYSLRDTSPDTDNSRNQNQSIHYGVPKKRSGHRAVCNNENMWIWGGFCPIREQNINEDDEDNENVYPSPLFPELWRFNFNTRRWCLLKTTGDIPDKFVASHSTILHGTSTLIVFGGTGFPFGESLSNSLYICNLGTLVWKKYELKGQKPLPLYGSSLLTVGDNLYILFGTNAVQYCSNVYRVNIKTLESVKLFDSIELIENATVADTHRLNQLYPNDFLTGRYRQEVVYYENKLYTFGGGKIDGDAHCFENLPAFNIETDNWEFINTYADVKTNSFPEKRKFHSCIRISDYVYVFGGMHCDLENNVFRSVENCVWRLNMLNLRWQKLDLKIPCLTYFHAACANDNGQVFIHGGVKSVNETNTRVNHLYSVSLMIPKLGDICWTKLIVNYPKLVYMNKKYLLSLGIPNEFIRRIN
ncbi:kelch domain-containing 10 -like protein [Brachionus plicatilis]|uniref:Kelch domain-containing 10-like protein n=1 Tax=Brachionus plicatilis TaxID=10195 RepID=A0A3M7SX79_BRAPC|nr:kelch domain-containing 10 -like protein [Brachionus plicatilis]